MTDHLPEPAVRGPDRFDQVEAYFTRYPDLTEAELVDLTHWYRKEASSFDVASFASKETTHEGYRRFRAEHIDGISWRDGMVTILIVAVVAAALGLIWLFKP